MSKNRTPPSSGKPPAPATRRPPGTLPLFVRLLLSLLVVWHLAAVILAAASIPPTSQMIGFLAQRPPVQWYTDALYLNHGYQFFAPNPGEGYLIRYEIDDRSGNVVHEGEFPNKKEQWPRLRYHRYFMLADQAGMPSPDEEEERGRWEQQYLQAYARQLLREYPDGETARVRRVAHYPLYPEHAAQGRKLDDPETYKTMLEVVQRRSDLEPEEAGQGSATSQQSSTGTTWESVAGRNGWQGGVR